MISCRLLLVAFVLLNVTVFGRRHRKFDQLINQQSITTNESSINRTNQSIDTRLIDRSDATNLTVPYRQFGVAYHWIPEDDNMFCCYRYESPKQCYRTPSLYSIKIYEDPPNFGYGRIDFGYSQEAPLIEKPIPIFWNVYGAGYTMRYTTPVPGVSNVSVSFNVDCGDGYRTHWRNFTKHWYRPSSNPQPYITYSGPYITHENVSDVLWGNMDVHWDGLWDTTRWNHGAMNFMQGGSNRMFWYSKNGVAVPVTMTLYDRNRFHAYHEVSPEVVFPYEEVFWPTYTYDLSTKPLPLYLCYQDENGDMYPIIRYEQHYNWHTYLVGDPWLHLGPPPNGVAGYGPLSSAEWNYTSRVDWDETSNSWQVKPGPNIVYTAYNDTTPVPSWQGTISGYPDLVGTIYRDEKQQEKCYCAAGSKGCWTPPPPTVAAKVEIENPWKKPGHSKRKPHYKLAIRV